MKAMAQEHKNFIEGMIDRHGLKGVLSVIGEICTEKAAHVREAWHDEALGKEWEKDAETLEIVQQEIINE